MKAHLLHQDQDVFFPAELHGGSGPLCRGTASRLSGSSHQTVTLPIHLPRDSAVYPWELDTLQGSLVEGECTISILISHSSRFLSPTSSPPSSAHSGPGVQCLAVERTPPEHLTNTPLCVCSKATLHIPGPLTVKGCSLPSIRSRSRCGGRLHPLRLPSPPCPLAGPIVKTRTGVPVSSEPGLAALRITVRRAPSPGSNTGPQPARRCGNYS